MTDTTAPVTVAAGCTAAEDVLVTSELGVYSALALGPATSLQLAERAELPERTARSLGDAMVGLGLLERRDGGYANTPAAEAHLAARRGIGPPAGSGHPRRWPCASSTRLASLRATATGTPRSGTRAHDPLAVTAVTAVPAGGRTRAARHAVVLAEHYDFARHRHVLHLGARSAAFLAEAVKRNPGLTGVLVGTGEPAARTVVDADLAGRITLHAADPLTDAQSDTQVDAGPAAAPSAGLDAVPGRYDAVLAHLPHRFDAARTGALLRVARGAVDPGAVLLLPDPSPHAPDRWSTVAEVRATGWRVRETRPLPGCPALVIAEAV